MPTTVCPPYNIKKKDILLRRIYLDANHIDLNNRVTSAGFKTKKGENGLSVDIEQLVNNIDSYYDKKRYTLARIKAEIPMETHTCVHDPDYKVSPPNCAHGLIKGDTRRIAKKLANDCHPTTPYKSRNSPQ